MPTGIQIGNGVKVSGTTRLFSTGTLTNTGNNLDMAIQGEGFFQITNPSGGFLYTRDGTSASIPPTSWSPPTVISSAHK